MGFHVCPAPNNVPEGETVYLHGNEPLIKPSSSGDIIVRVPGTERRWLFPDGLLHYSIDSGYMPPAQFLEDIKRHDLEIQREQTRGGQDKGHSDSYCNLLGGQIGYLAQDDVNSERANPWGNCDRFSAFVRNIRDNVLEKIPEVLGKPDPTARALIELLNTPAVDERANLGKDREPLTLPAEELIRRADPIHVSATIENRSLKLTLSGLQDDQNMRLWQKAINWFCKDWSRDGRPTASMELEQDPAGTSKLTVSFVRSRKDENGLSAALNLIDGVFHDSYWECIGGYIGGYYTPEGLEITSANFVEEVGNILKNAKPVRKTRTRSQGTATEETLKQQNQRKEGRKQKSIGEIKGEPPTPSGGSRTMSP